MPETKSYTAYYKPLPLGFWFYFWLVLLIMVIVFNIIRLIWPSSDSSDWKNWLGPTAHLFIFYSTGERLYKQYKNSKIKNCFVAVDASGINWNLNQGNYHVKEREMISWEDVKKIIIEKDKFTVKYMSTYFSDTIPIAKLTEEDQQLLREALADQIQYRSITCENRAAA